MGDLYFTVYFDFETITGDNILHDSKMFVISYRQIYTFHPDINLDKNSRIKWNWKTNIYQEKCHRLFQSVGLGYPQT